MTERKTDLEVQVTGEDGNVFNIVGIVSKQLRRNGYTEYSNEVFTHMKQCGSYDEVLQMLQEYVELY